MEHDFKLLSTEYSNFSHVAVDDVSEEDYQSALEGFLRLHPNQIDSFKNCSLVKELDDSAQGTGFAFIVMADVFTKIPGAPFWSALFFMMLLSLGLGSQIGILEGVISTLFDQPSLKNVKKPLLVGVVAVTCFCIALMLLIIISSIYFMFKHKPTYSGWDGEKARGVTNEYPNWALAVAAILAVSSLVPVAGGGVFYLVRRMMYGSAGVQERCQYEANLEKKFCRTETSASMKPMLGPDYLDLPVIGGDSASENESDDKSESG